MPTREILITLLDRIDEAKQTLALVEGVTGVQDVPDDHGRRRIRVDFSGDDEELSKLLLALAQRGVPVVNFVEETHDLEAVFMRATKGIVS